MNDILSTALYMHGLRQKEAMQQRARMLEIQNAFANQVRQRQQSELERINEEFLTAFHSGVLSDGSELSEDDLVTTMRLASFDADGQTYLLPTYNPVDKRVMSDMDEIFNFHMPAIRSGKVRGFPSVEEAEAFRRRVYPRILRGSNFSELINPTDQAFSRILGGLM